MKRLFLILLTLGLSVAASNYRGYTVKKGDTLHSISKKLYGNDTKWKTIVDLNELIKPYIIKEGQFLKVPDEPYVGEKATKENLSKNEPPKKKEKPSIEPVKSTENNEAQDDLTTQEEADLFLEEIKNSSTAKLLMAIALLFLIAWVIHTLTLRAACWFSLVETTVPKCMKLSLMLAFIIVLHISMIVMAAINMPDKLPLTVGFTTLFSFTMYILLTKKILDCQLRSVVTVHIMSYFTSNIIMVLIIIATHFSLK